MELGGAELDDGAVGGVHDHVAYHIGDVVYGTVTEAAYHLGLPAYRIGPACASELALHIWTPCLPHVVQFYVLGRRQPLQHLVSGILYYLAGGAQRGLLGQSGPYQGAGGSPAGLGGYGEYLGYDDWVE